MASAIHERKKGPMKVPIDERLAQPILPHRLQRAARRPPPLASFPQAEVRG